MPRPRIIELVGIAGAGKTTLARALSLRNDRILICEQPYFRRAIYFPYFSWYSLMMMPTILRIQCRSKQLTINPRLAVWMINLQGWHKVLKMQVKIHNATCIMHQGPISMMAEILFLYPNALQDEYFAKWWERMISAWKATLDLIIWLDAEDRILIKRVRQRDNWHMIKNQSEDEALWFYQVYRAIYRRLLSSLDNHDDSKIISIDTGNQTVNAINDQVFKKLGIESRQ